MATHDFSSMIEDIEKVVTGIDGQIKKISINRLTSPGENYISLVFRVDFDVEKNGKSQTISAVAKRLPMGNKSVDFHARAMKNEIKWYSEMVPMLKEFGKEINLDIDYYPDYLGGRFSMDPTKTDADQGSVLLLHNLILDGYKNEDRYIGFDLISAKTLLSTLANFHAVPLIMKYKRPDLSKQFKTFFDSCAIKPPGKNESDDSGGKHRPLGEGDPPKRLPIGLLLDVILADPQFQPYKEKLETLKNSLHGPDTLVKPEIELWYTNVHKDFWVNNIMIKPREGEGPLVKFVDFQLTIYSSYAKDVVFFLLTSIRNDVMRHNFDELLRHYYEELTTIIENAGVSDLKLTFEDYLEELKRVALESDVSRAIFFSAIVFGEKGNAPDGLADEFDMYAHMEIMARNISDKQKERLMIILELTTAREWI